MAIDELGHGVKYDVCAQLQRPLKVGAGKSVVHRHQAAMSVGNG